METWTMIVATGVMAGFGTFQTPALAAKAPSLKEVRKDLKDGDLYQARKKTQLILENDQDNAEAQKLMADIIDQEIARHKEIFKTNVPEEVPQSDKDEETKTWLERAKVLMDLKRYDEAVLAAEKVFEYDPQNQTASALMDQIRERAVRDGKQELLVRHEMYRDESKERVRMYLDQSRKALKQKRWGAARLAIEKTLLLEPSNRKALRYQKYMEKHKNEKPAITTGAPS